MKKRKRTGLFPLLLAVALLASAAPAAGAEVELDRVGSITLSLPKESGSGGEHFSFCLYRVGEALRTEMGLCYALTADFTGSGAALDDLRADGLADRLAGYVKDKELSGTAGQTDNTGKVTFSDLPVGLYLLIQEAEEGGYYAVKPFLVSVPLADATGGGWLYDVDASPKMEQKPAPTPTVTPYPTRNTATCVVTPPPAPSGDDGGGDDAPSPSSDPAPTPPVTPSDEPAPPTLPDVDLPIPAPAPAETQPPGTDDSADTLLQTGQQRWPIPLLAAVGLLLFALGWALTFGKRGGGGDEA